MKNVSAAGLVLLICGMLAAAPLRAQDRGEYYGPYAFKSGSDQYVWADTANIRSTPSLSGTVITSFPAGSTVKILQEERVMSAGKKTAPWYKVSYTTEAEEIVGYLWGGLLSLAPLRAADTRFVYGIESTPRRAESLYDSSGYDTASRLTITLKAVRGGQVVDRKAYNIYEEAVNGIEGKLTDNRKLAQFSRLVWLGFSGQACGIPTYAHVFGWNGTSLIPLPPLESVSDAGVYYHEEEAIFPADKGGRPDRIIVRTTEGEFDEKKDKYIDKKPKDKVYSWDAKAGIFRPGRS